MISMKEMVDGMECFFRFTGHSEERMIERMITYEDVINDCRLAADDIFSLKLGSEVNLVNKAKNRIIAIAMNNDDEFNTFIDVKTVIAANYAKKNYENIIVNDTKEEK